MEESILKHLAQYYSLNGKLKPLDSYIDKNYLLLTNENKRFVVKLANPKTELEKIILENSAMQHLVRKSLPISTPEVINTINGDDYTYFKSGETQWTLRVLTWLDGDLYYQISNPDENTHRSLGKLVGQMTWGLSQFQSPAATRSFKWDLAQLELVATDIQFYDGEKKRLLEEQLEHFVSDTKPILASLPKQVIHNDCNDYNIVMSTENGSPVCSGVFDFGDLVYTQRVCDLAVALTYALFNQENILKVTADITESYLSIVKLTTKELKILLDLVQVRLTQSLLNSAESYYRDPINQYILVSQKPAWELLIKLNRLSSKEKLEFHNKLIDRLHEQN